MRLAWRRDETGMEGLECRGMNGMQGRGVGNGGGSSGLGVGSCVEVDTWGV